MKREIITISDNGVITVPTASTSPILMCDFEIAELFGVFSQTIKSNIRAILKLGVVRAGYTYGGVVTGNSILPDYYGLDMITALAFRIHSPQTQLYREYIQRQLCKVSSSNIAVIVVGINKSQSEAIH